MRIKAVANGNVIEAHEDAAKELIEAGIYEKVSDKEPITNSLTPPTAVKPMGTDDFPEAPKAKAKGHKTK